MKLPLVPTAMVALGAPALLALGFWQLDRRQEKAAALVAFAAPEVGRFTCAPLEGPVEQRGGRNRAGQTGYSHFANCMLGGEAVKINLGWTARPRALPSPSGDATVRALLYTVPDAGRMLVVTEPPAPLRPSAPPDPAEIPNNHLAYAMQWFAFAVTLPVIYALWLRRWHRERRG